MFECFLKFKALREVKINKYIEYKEGSKFEIRTWRNRKGGYVWVRLNLCFICGVIK